MEGQPGEALDPKLLKVGDKLRAAREAKGMELADVAARTRVPLRHLTGIEASDYSGLPSPTYAVGFVKAYARAVGADEVELARELRNETSTMFAAREIYETYDPEDPVREPPRGLALAGVVITVLIVIAVGIWYSMSRSPSSEPLPEPTPTESPTPVAQPSATPAVTGSQVTLIATKPVWLRIVDADGTRLFEKEMAAGERYDVPRDANGPMINLGRPEAVQVTIDGVEVPTLGKAGIAIRDVPISAEALRARPAPVASPTPAARPSASPTPRSTPSAQATHHSPPPAALAPVRQPVAAEPAPAAAPAENPDA